MTFDSGDGYLLLVDNGTWAFLGGEWHLLVPKSATPSLFWPRLKYDAADG